MTFSTLFKSMTRDAKESFDAARGNNRASVPEPLGLRRGGFVNIDATPFRMLADRMNFAIGVCEQPIAARGFIDLTSSYLHRFYLDDDATWLQIKTDGGTDDACVSDCILWQYWDTKTPANQTELKLIAGPDSAIGMPSYDIGTYSYQRVWGVSRGNTELIPLSEQVFDKSDITSSFTCQHHCMLYRREIQGSERQEYVIVSVEESPDSLQVVTSVGIDLLRADIAVT